MRMVGGIGMSRDGTFSALLVRTSICREEGRFHEYHCGPDETLKWRRCDSIKYDINMGIGFVKVFRPLL